MKHRNLQLSEINALEEHHKSPGLRLATASGLTGEVVNSDQAISSLLTMSKASIEQKNLIQKEGAKLCSMRRLGNLMDLCEDQKTISTARLYRILNELDNDLRAVARRLNGYQ